MFLTPSHSNRLELADSLHARGELFDFLVVKELPRLIGIQAALPLLLQGTLIGPQAALEAGIVDAIADPADLLTVAKRWLLETGDPVARWDRPGFVIPGGAGALVPDVRNLFSISNVMSRANGFGNYPAPAAILAAVYEGSGAEAWGLDRLPPGNAEAQTRGIVAFRIPLSRVETKLKLSQNRELEDRQRVITRLEASDSQDSQATAKWMKRVLP